MARGAGCARRCSSRRVRSFWTLNRSVSVGRTGVSARTYGANTGAASGVVAGGAGGKLVVGTLRACRTLGTCGGPCRGVVPAGTYRGRAGVVVAVAVEPCRTLGARCAHRRCIVAGAAGGRKGVGAGTGVVRRTGCATRGSCRAVKARRTALWREAGTSAELAGGAVGACGAARS